MLLVKKSIRFIAFMISDELGFQQFEKQYPVDPCNAKFQADIKKPFFMAVTVLAWLFQLADLIQAVQLYNGVFQNTARMSATDRVSADEFCASFLCFSQTDDVQQFAIKSLVETVAVIGKRQLEQMLGREELIKGNQFCIIFFIRIPQRLFIILDVKISKLKLGFDFFDFWLGNISIKELSFYIG